MPPLAAFLFAFFVGNGTDGLHLAQSTDGLHYAALAENKSVLTPAAGRARLFRDPCIARGPDGVFRLVWTCDWQGNEIGFATSTDLVHWSPQRSLPVMAAVTGTRNCWAPELVFDQARRHWVIFWASTVDGKFPETAATSEDGYNHRIWFTTTTDFESFAPSAVLFDPGFSVIDGTFLSAPDGSLHFIAKDETRFPQPRKTLFLADAASPTGPFGPSSAPISPAWVEGPTAVTLGSDAFVFFDAYRDHHYGAIRSSDLVHWTDATPAITIPAGARHGTIIPVEAAFASTLADRLSASAPPSTGNPVEKSFPHGAPTHFSAPLPEGNYRVTLALRGLAKPARLTVRAESRRLMLANQLVSPNSSSSLSFLVNIRTPAFPGGSVALKPREVGYLHWDDRLSLEFSGDRAAVTSVRIEPAPDVPTVYIAGDSTVTDQPAEPWAAWGQLLPGFFDDGIAVANHAESGETLRAFDHEGRLSKILSTIHKGDYLLIQFTHNDQKPGPNHVDHEAFKDYLKRYAEAARARGATPIFVTSPQRRRFDASGHIIDTLAGYPAAMHEAGTEARVPVIDLTAATIPFYEALGPELSKRAFVHYPANTFPDQPEPLHDDTHFSSYGAYELARFVADGLRTAAPALAAHLRPDIVPIDPRHPLLLSDWSIPPSAPPPRLVAPDMVP